MDHADQPPGWQISQVVELIDMPRRDITRSCYADRASGAARAFCSRWTAHGAGETTAWRI